MVGVCYALFSFFVIILTTFALSLDVRHLNPALLLKWLLFESRVRGRYIQIFDVETISWSAITSTGSECVRPYSFELWFHFVFLLAFNLYIDDHVSGRTRLYHCECLHPCY